VRALARSPRRPRVLCAPGNPGIAADARLLDVAVDDLDGIVRAARHERVDLVVVGPEAPLVAGLVDRLRAAGVAAFGPTAAAARLEGSKAFAKEVMAEAGVPTPAARTVTTTAEGLAAVPRYPVVLKADGLAAGKGVVIAEDEAAARAALDDLLAGHGTVLVEEHLTGDEVSLLAVCDGERAVALAPARDHKRIFDGDRGPNTGGMGAYSPVPGVDVAGLLATVHQPVVDAMRARGTPFTGVLYAGLMLTADGPRVLEFNVRLGDPEAQAVLARLESDVLDLLTGAPAPPRFDDGWAVHVVLASAGYPAASSRGDVITGLDAVPPGAEVVHAGTALDGEGRVVTAGGRVLGVTGRGADREAARAAAYAAADRIRFDGRQLRRDIAL
jgi:phosphoribosylamine--glycine ligase